MEQNEMPSDNNTQSQDPHVTIYEALDTGLVSQQKMEIWGQTTVKICTNLWSLMLQNLTTKFFNCYQFYY